MERKAVLIQEKIRELPEPLNGNLPARLYGELMKFEFELARHFDGGFKESFQREWHNISVDFRDIMAGSYPLVTLTTTQTPSRKARSSTSFSDMLGTPTPTRNPAPISIDSDSDDNDEPLKTSPTSRQRITRKRPHSSTQSTPQKTARINEIPRSEADKPGRKQFELDEIRKIRQDHYIGLPGETDPKATETMIKLSMAHWEDPVNQYIDRTGKLCENMVYERVVNVFEHRQNTQFYSELTDICGDFVTKAIDDQRKLVKQILSWELKKPATLNEVAIEVEKDKAVDFLQKKRRERLAKAWLDQEEERSGKQTIGQARMDKMAKVTDAQLGPDPYCLEIKAMGVSQSGLYILSPLTIWEVCASLLRVCIFQICRHRSC